MVARLPVTLLIATGMLGCASEPATDRYGNRMVDHGMPGELLDRLELQECQPATDAGPTIVNARFPPYPASILANDRHSIAFEFQVDVAGRTQNFTVIRSTHDGLSAAAERAVRKWRFEPARKEGQPVAVTCKQLHRFELK